MNSILVRKLRVALLRWFAHYRRDLPWRRDNDPYRVWISEIMLQQTRVAAVLDHYGRFLKRFPDVRALARARPASVLAAWSGLGYYRRARLMHAAARQIVSEREGRLPQTSADWLQLPGIGRYTAAAIASICHGEPCAAVDGNVERVLQRVLGCTAAETWTAASRLLSRRRPGDFNQALMELGALVCTPRSPNCRECPLRKSCVTAKGPAQQSLPAWELGFGALASRPAVVRESTPSLVRASSPGVDRQLAPKRRERAELICALSADGDRVLLTQRTKSETVMPGMWELPVVDSATKLAMDSVQPALSVRHAIMNTSYTVRVIRVPGRASFRPVGSGKWFQAKQAARLPLTGLARKILKRAEII